MESISIEGYDVPFTNARATFNKVLTEGYSYTLVISFKQTRWAKSNIYWKWRDDSNHDLGGDLTFDTNENGHQGYQGVYFKWGSLVGISPAQAGGSDDYIGQDIPLYVPVVEYPLENSSWEMTSSVAKGWTDWGLNTARDEDIPYMDPDNYEGGNYGRTNEYAMDAVRNEYAVYKNYRGDICQYLSTKTGVVAGDWRLPTSEELGPQATGTVGTYWSAEVPIVEGWMRGIDPWPATNTAAGYADGTADLLDPAGNNGGIVYASAIYQPEGNVVFPASGQRERDDGRLGEIGGRGQYWTGSLHSKPSGYGLDYRNASVIRIDSSNRSYAYPVRCVQN
jgi:hypothetical protein